MANMTKDNIEKAIRDYLSEHLDLIPEVERKDLFDVKIKNIILNEDSYKGKGWYTFTGEGEGWIETLDNGKSRKCFRILPSKALISGDDKPVVEEISYPVLITFI